VNCAEMAEDRSGQLAHEIFLLLNVGFRSPCTDLQCSTRPAHAGVKEGYSLKSGYFTATSLSIMKTVADRQRHVAYHKKH